VFVFPNSPQVALSSKGAMLRGKVSDPRFYGSQIASSAALQDQTVLKIFKAAYDRDFFEEESREEKQLVADAQVFFFF
jgi:hypothetical protein